MANWAFWVVKTLDLDIASCTIAHQPFAPSLAFTLCLPLLLLVCLHTSTPIVCFITHHHIIRAHATESYENTTNPQTHQTHQTHRNTSNPQHAPTTTPAYTTMRLHLLILTFITHTQALPTNLTSRTDQVSAAKSPAWRNAATFTLICYDLVLGSAFCCMWVSGYLAWVRREHAREIERAGRAGEEVWRGARGRAGRGTLIEDEMRTLGMI
jgi:hypothetical protein